MVTVRLIGGSHALCRGRTAPRTLLAFMFLACINVPRAGGSMAPNEANPAAAVRRAGVPGGEVKLRGSTVKPSAAPTVSLEPPVGTRDFYPEQMRVRSWLFSHFRAVARSFGFQEYDAPVLEHAELYTRKAGEEITGQMYNFVDKGGYNVTLRPEMTPSLARMVLAREKELLLPLKWFAIPQCFRFENLQRGRKREHYQWNMDIVGVSAVSAEAELLAALVALFRALGLGPEDVVVRVNSRRVLAALLAALGVPDSALPSVCIALDKLERLGAEATRAALVALLPGGEGAAARADRVVAAASLRSLEELRAFAADLGGAEGAEGAGGAGAMEAAITEVEELFALLRACGAAEYAAFDASVVRGLAYYTGVVFEAADRRGALRAICGGGRYDALLSLYGARAPVPCVGFGFGDCVVLELLADLGRLPALPRRVDVAVAAYGAADLPHALAVAAALREGGAAVDVSLARRRVKQAFDYADRAGAGPPPAPAPPPPRRCAPAAPDARRGAGAADYMVLVAPDEWARGCVRFKALRAPLPPQVRELAPAPEAGGAGEEGAPGGGKEGDVRVADLGAVARVLRQLRAAEEGG